MSKPTTSKCCNAPAVIESVEGSSGTNYHVCTKCTRPCDVRDTDAPETFHRVGDGSIEFKRIERGGGLVLLMCHHAKPHPPNLKQIDRALAQGVPDLDFGMFAVDGRGDSFLFFRNATIVDEFLSQLRGASSAPDGEGEADTISFAALLIVLARLKSKNRNPNRDWYLGWNSALDCLINDIKARHLSDDIDQHGRQIPFDRAATPSSPAPETRVGHDNPPSYRELTSEDVRRSPAPDALHALSIDEIEQFNHMADSWTDMPTWARDLFQRAYSQLRNSPAPDKGEVARLLEALADEERLELFNEYCKSCGKDDPSCQCWNDE